MTGMIAAPQPEAVEAGAKVLADGGNAYDAALACAFVQFIVDPHSCGVGGYLLLTSQPAGLPEPQPTLDAPALAGIRRAVAKTLPRTLVDSSGSTLSELNHLIVPWEIVSQHPCRSG